MTPPAARAVAPDDPAVAAALERAHSAEALLQDAIDSISEGFVIYDRDDRLVMCNDAYRELYRDCAAAMVPGTRYEEILRAGLVKGVFADAVGREDAWLAERLGEHHAATAIIEQRLADGRWVHLSERPMRGGGIAGLRVDITRLKAAEAALRDSEERLRRSQQHLTHAQELGSIGSYERYFDREPAEWSPEAYRIFGVTPGSFEPTKANYLAMVHPDDRARVVENKYGTLARGVPVEIEYRIVRPDGEVRFIRNRVSPIRDAGGALIGAIGTLQDITLQRLTERQLVQAQKMEAIGNLTGGIAHDFNNLLTVILANSEELAEQLDGSQRDLAREAGLAARRGAELASRLLTFARRQVLRPAEIDVNGLVQRMAALLARTLGENIEISVRLPYDSPAVSADATQLESALLNLAINSRDAMPNGGKLTVEVDRVTLDAATFANADVRPGDYVVLALVDTGVGMPPDVAAQAFEPFFTTKEFGKGSGLGLSMVYGFAKQSGGHVTIESEPGRGTVVRLYLPAERRRQRREMPPPVAAPLPSRGGETILVVEDDDLVRESVVRRLQRLGYRVIEAANGGDALARLAEQPIDLIFTDVVMPGGMSGIDLAVAARALLPKVRILFTSGYSEEAVAQHGRLAGEARLLCKPYEVQELARTLREVLEANPEARPA
jgi:PAS domain S-box-containing protein